MFFQVIKKNIYVGILLFSIAIILFPRLISAADTCCEYLLGDEGFDFITSDSRYSNFSKDAPRCISGIAKEECEKKKSPVFYENKTCDIKNNKCVCPEGKLCLQVPFPGSNVVEQTAQSDTAGLLGKYIVTVFQFLVWIAISLSIFMIMVAGFMWLISAGNRSMIGRAKGYITNALYGLIITLLSYVILETINPQLVDLKMPAINAVPTLIARGDQCCYETSTFDIKAGISLIEGGTCQDAFKSLGGNWEECTANYKKYISDAKSCCKCTYSVTAAFGLFKVGDVKSSCSKNPISEGECKKGTFLGSVLGGASFLTNIKYNCNYIGDPIKCFEEQVCRESS